MKKISFTCDPDLSKYTDSMLFPSGTIIANGLFEHEGEILNIYLIVNGVVRVTFNGNVYRNPARFPKELKDLIRQYPNEWMTATDRYGNAKVYCGSNNWFEYSYNGGSSVYEQNLSKDKPGGIEEDMINIAYSYFGIEASCGFSPKKHEEVGCYGAGSEACLDSCKGCDDFRPTLFKMLEPHIGHTIEIVRYGDDNISIEDMDTNEVIFDTDVYDLVGRS